MNKYTFLQEVNTNKHQSLSQSFMGFSTDSTLSLFFKIYTFSDPQKILYFQTALKNRIEYLLKLEGKKSLLSQCKSMQYNREFSDKQTKFYLIRPFLHNNTLNQMFEDRLFDKIDLNLRRITANLISLCISGGGYDDAIMTGWNIYHQPATNSFSMDATAFTGRSLSCMKQNCQSVSWNTYKQLLPYLDSKFFERKIGKRIDFRLKIRSIAVVLLTIILQKNVSFHFDEKKAMVNYQDLKRFLAILPQKYQKLLKISVIQNSIKSASLKYDVNYQQFFQKVLILEEQLDWRQIIKMLLLNQNKYNNRTKLIRKIDEENFEIFFKDNFLRQSEIKRKWFIERKLDDPELFMLINSGASIEKLLQYDSISDFMNMNETENETTNNLFKYFIESEQKRFHQNKLAEEKSNAESKQYDLKLKNIQVDTQFQERVNIYCEVLKTTKVTIREDCYIIDSAARALRQFFNFESQLKSEKRQDLKKPR